MLLPMLRLFLGTSRDSDRSAETEMEVVETPMSGNDKRKYWATAAKVTVLTVLYVLSLEYLPMDYRWLTMGFICLFGVVIGSWGIVFRRLRSFQIFLDVVVLVPFWIYAVFQSGLNIELP
jgi:hypothetical protein